MTNNELKAELKVLHVRAIAEQVRLEKKAILSSTGCPQSVEYAFYYDLKAKFYDVLYEYMTKFDGILVWEEDSVEDFVKKKFGIDMFELEFTEGETECSTG